MTLSADDTPFQRRLLREIEAAKVKAATKARREETHRVRGQVMRMHEELRLMGDHVRDLETSINRVDREKRERRELLNQLLDVMQKLMLDPTPMVMVEARIIYRKFRP